MLNMLPPPQHHQLQVALLVTTANDCPIISCFWGCQESCQKHGIAAVWDPHNQPLLWSMGHLNSTAVTVLTPAPSKWHRVTSLARLPAHLANKWRLEGKIGKWAADTIFIIITMIHSRRKSIPLNRIEWLIKGYKSWLESCTDWITLGEKLAMSSWTLFPFVFWLRAAIKRLSYEDLSKQVMLWYGRAAGKKGTEKVPEVLTDSDVNKQNMPIAAFLTRLKEHSNGTWDKHLRLLRTALFNSVLPQPLDRLIRNCFDCDILQLQIKTVSKSSLQQISLHLAFIFQTV